MFRVSRLFSVSSGLVAIAGSTVGRMFQDRLTLLQIRLDVADEFLGFRFEAAGHVGHVTRRDVCGCFRFVRVTGEHTQLASDIYLVYFALYTYFQQARRGRETELECREDDKTRIVRRNEKMAKRRIVIVAILE